MMDSNKQYTLNLRVTNQASQASSSVQTTGQSETVNSLLNCIISCYKGAEVEPWSVFSLTPEEYKALWTILERKESLHGWVLDKLR